MNKDFLKPTRNKMSLTVILVFFLFFCLCLFYPIVDTINFYISSSLPFQWHDTPCPTFSKQGPSAMCPLYRTYPKFFGFILFTFLILVTFFTASYLLSCFLLGKKQKQALKRKS